MTFEHRKVAPTEKGYTYSHGWWKGGGTEPYTSSQKLNWGWEFDLRFDSLPRLGFKEVACIVITLDPPVAKLAYKNEHQSTYNKA